MELPPFGCREYVLNNHLKDATLEARAEQGIVVGKSTHTVGAYRIWILGWSCFRLSSDLRFDISLFPWRGMSSAEEIPPPPPALHGSVLYLFSGSFGRPGGLADYLSRAGIECVEV